jgi:hypothetical protein
MPSRAKRWFPADEDESHKIFRFEDEGDPEIWMEIWFDKASEHHIRCRCNFNTPGKWHRFEEPLRDYQIAKRQAFEYLFKRILKLARAAYRSHERKKRDRK